MTPNGFRKLALAFDDATEGTHMGHPDFRVKGKIFATLHADNTHGMVRLTPEQQAHYLTQHSCHVHTRKRRMGPTRSHTRAAGGR
jgi:YjbR